MKYLRWLLLPFSVLYSAVTAFRNWLYDTKIKKSYSFPVPLISVGNLSVGGTGKTPHVEYLIRLLKGQFQTVTLSRGYGRKSKGFFLADPFSTAAGIGDEPLQLHRKFWPDVVVAVGEKRALAIPKILKHKPGTQVILLDDAFQHRSVKPSLSILLTDFSRPFYKDFVLPMGRLRESRNGASRADVVIVTKCPPDLGITQQKEIIKQIRPYIDINVPVFCTGIHYGSPVGFGLPEAVFNPKVVLVTGIANPKPLEEYIQTNFELAGQLIFKDHHAYSPQDILEIAKWIQSGSARSIVVTEKDYVKLMDSQLLDLVRELPFFYLPIEIKFLGDDTTLFDQLIKKNLTISRK
jgi:tetraacyldisaccharide 4'-kinase